MQTPLLPNDATVAGNVDFKGRPSKRSNSGRWLSAGFIMVMEMAERSAYFGISSNLMSYLTGPLGQSTSTAAVNINAWSGTAQLLPLLGAFVADSFLGRCRTIVLSFALYILGLGMLAFSAVIPSMFGYSIQFQIVVFFLSLYLVAIAQGLCKPSLQAFGVDQFDELNQAESLAKSSFFNWCSVCISVAITVSLLTLTYIQENLSWGLGFGIPCLLMCFGLVCFLLGTTTYRFRVSGDQENAFSRIGRVFVKAARNWRASCSSLSKEEESSHTDSSFRQCKFLNNAMVAKEDENECSISEVEEAKAVLKLFPIWFSCLVYGIVYSQPSTLFTKQGLTMNRSISPGFQVPAASLQCLINLTMIAFIPIYDCILVPITRSLTRKPSGITMLQRIGIGIFLSVLSMSVAALVERKRLDVAMENRLVEQPNSVVPVSVAWLIPQYLLFGLSESFAFIGIQEFFYDQVPGELKSSGISLYLSVLGVGGFLSSIVISAIKKMSGGDGDCGWFCDNLNKAHLDYFYWLLAGLSAMTLVIFVYFAEGYVYRRKLLEIKSHYEA